MDYKDLFYEDSIEKQVKITSDDRLINITNEELDGENMELTESLCTAEQLTFGSCSAAMLKFTVSNVMVPMKGAWLNVDIGLSGMEDYRLGRYKVDSDKPTADRMYRDGIAYDALYDVINANMADWYNALLPDSDSTVNLKQFRDKFFTYFGIEQADISLPNDTMLVERTVLPSQFSGATVVNCICEANGCFGHINRAGRFEYVYLTPISDAHDIPKRLYTTATYEDYLVKTIDKLQIRQEEDDIGVIVGTGTNAYIIENNFLFYGKSTEELKNIAENIFSRIQGLVYRPFTAEGIGNPCIEPGDAVRINSSGTIIESYVLSRTLKGVQSLKDSYEAAGSEQRSEQVNSVHQQIEQLKGKANVLKREIEVTKSTISDVEQGLKNDIEQTSNRFAVEIEALQSQVDGDVKQYNVDYEPTLLNYPAWDFTYNIPCNNTVQLRDDLKFIYKDSYYSKNARSVVFDYATSMSYRFVKEDDVWYWKPIGDTEFGVAMSKIAKLEVTTEDISTQVSSLDKKITNDYITTADCNTKINQTSESIKQEANATYATRTMLGDYSTTVKMNAAIELAASGIKQEVSANYATKTSLSQTEQKADKITWLIKSGTSAANMALTSEMYKLLADNITLSGKHITLDGDTVVSAGFTLSCDRLKGGEINGQRIIGCTMSGGAASFGGNNIILNDGGLWVIGDGSAGAPSYAVNNRGEVVQYWSDGIRRFYSNGLTVKGTWVTHFDEYTASSNWYQICIAANNTSDKRQKNNIKSLDDENNLNQLFDELKPSAFYYNKDSGYIETQRHLGFIAQDVEKAIETAGIEYDMALFDHMDEDKLGVNKQELIALCVWQIQKLKKQVSMLTDTMAELIMNKEAADA
nr:MAG TPA: endosialidase chaperone [Caudoviricetes sp.]